MNLPEAPPVLIQSGLAMLAMAKMSAVRKRHPEITVSLSMSVHKLQVREFLSHLKGGGTSSSTRTARVSNVHG